jgi:hypothetical protein
MCITCAGLEVCSTRQEQQSRLTSSLIEREGRTALLNR